MKNNTFRPIILLTAILTVIFFTGCNNENTEGWSAQQGPLATRWAKDVTPGKTWTGYPRPQMERSGWRNLNGLWDYAVTDTLSGIPATWDGKILVPYPIESSLSGVMKRVYAKDRIWYQRTLKVPARMKSTRLLLNFEAVDWETHVFIDGSEIGSHRGGYDPFSFDITDRVKPGVAHTLTVSVWDPSTEGYQPVGKQFTKPTGIWYTPSSGIWQTVWLEKVPASYITDYRITPDIDSQVVKIRTSCQNARSGDRIQIQVFDGRKPIAMVEGKPGEEVVADIPGMHLWSPDDPFLYDLQVKLLRRSAVVDKVKGYFGMRKISIGKDESGVTRILLNNKFLFQNGPLDQGFWPDGLYTPPTEEAMVADLDSLKAMGFNMLRKHVKVEPRRFYYHTDHMGMLVWQDMPSMYYAIPVKDDTLPVARMARENFENELTELIRDHINPPSIVMWVPFNEGWGQYETPRIVDRVRSLDPSRLVDNASGWTDTGTGDVSDVHHYPDPVAPPMEENRAVVLGEFGGLGLYVPDHVWQKENWGYEKMQSRDELLEKYENFYQEVYRLRDEAGLSACVYTQTTDVETETNGLMTYDRFEVKMGLKNVAMANRGKVAPRLTSDIREFTDSYEAGLTSPAPGAVIRYTTDNTQPTENSETFSSPLTFTSNTTLKAKAFWSDGDTSRTATFEIKKVTPAPASTASAGNSGLKVAFFKGNWNKIPDFSGMRPARTGRATRVNLDFAKTDQLFGLTFKGYLDAPVTGVYRIYLSSDDGGRILLGGKQLIDYDGIHGAGEKAATIALGKGLHPFELLYFQRQGGLGLKVSWEGPGFGKEEITSFRME